MAKGDIITCMICGREFTQKSVTWQKYCSDKCRRIAKGRQAKIKRDALSGKTDDPQVFIDEDPNDVRKPCPGYVHGAIHRPCPDHAMIGHDVYRCDRCWMRMGRIKGSEHGMLNDDF